jgi:hypothetical protein
VSQAPSVGLDPAERATILRALIATGRDRKDQAALSAAPGQDADHAAFCPAMRSLVDETLAQPPAERVPAWRAVLSGG